MAKASKAKRVKDGVMYRGEKFPGFNKPKRNTKVKGKSKRVLAKKGDEVKIVNFGDSDMRIKKGQKSNKKSYCARSSGIKGKGDKFSANYWSRKAWDC